MKVRLTVGMVTALACFATSAVATSTAATAAATPGFVTTNVIVAKSGANNAFPDDNTVASAYTDATGHIVSGVGVNGTDPDGFPTTLVTKKMSVLVTQNTQNAYITVWIAKGMTGQYSQFTTSAPGAGTSFGPGLITHKSDGSTVVVFIIARSRNLVAMTVGANDPAPSAAGAVASPVTWKAVINPHPEVNETTGSFNLDAEASTNSTGHVVTFAGQILSSAAGVDTFATTADLVVTARQGATFVSGNHLISDPRGATITVTVAATVKIVVQGYGVSSTSGVGTAGRASVTRGANGATILTVIVKCGQHLDFLSVYGNDPALHQIGN